MTKPIHNDPAGSSAGRPPASFTEKREPAAPFVRLSFREDDRAVLRPMVADVEGALSTLLAQVESTAYAQTSTRLAESWRHLVAVMALGTAPELRSCPHCQHRIRRAATRCIQCWKESPGDRA